MNRNRFSFAFGAGLTTLCLVVTFLPVSVVSQQPTARSRPAARAKAGSALPAAPTPAPTPPPLAAPKEATSDNATPPTDDATPKGVDTETDIDATQSASFNSKDRIAVFTGNVKVKDPRFELACDELTVYLNKGAAPDGTAPDAATPTPAPLPAGQKPSTPSGGGIDHAVARGHVIIIQRKAATKPGEEEKLSIGRGGIGTFDNKTGDMVLKDWPSLEQNGSSLIATAQGTVMTIHRDSSMNTDGPSKTKLISKKGSGNDGGIAFPTGPASPAGNRARGNQPPAPAGAAGNGSRTPGN